MGKIIKITDSQVAIGMRDGSLKEVPISSLDFTPHLGMVVDVYESTTEIVVLLKPIYHDGQGRLVNKIAYILLAFFLGGLGVHKFYAKKTAMGVLYLIFCRTGIPAFVSLIEAILAFTKKADANGNIIL